MSKNGKGLSGTYEYIRMELCFICGKDIGEIIIKRLSRKANIPDKVHRGNFCDKCAEPVLHNMIYVIETKEHSTGQSPHRTGRIVVIDKESIKFSPEAPVLYMSVVEFNKAFNHMFNGSKPKRIWSSPGKLDS